MSVVIDGNNGVSGNNGTAATPTLRGDDADTGIYFPSANAVAVSTGGVQRATFTSSGLTLDAPQFEIRGSSPSVTLANNNYLAGGALFQMSADGRAQFDAFDSTFTTGEFRFQAGFVEVARITGTGNLQFNSGYGSVATAYGCRAWVNFNGTNGAIRASGGVSSVTYNGTGQSTVNFSTAMPDINYSAVCSAHSATFGRQSNAFPLYNGYATGSVVIWYGNTVNAAAENLSHVNVAVFR